MSQRRTFTSLRNRQVSGPRGGWSGAKDPETLEDTGVALHIITPKVDELWSNAVAPGAKVHMPLDDQFWGDRYGQLRDPFWHHWALSWKSKRSKAELKATVVGAMKAFAGGGPPE
jgi:PhnB protein